MTSTKLSPEDWIQAAFRRLGSSGVGAIRAEAVARDLGVSKGSFYWHFKDLADLKLRMLAHWEDQATDRIIRLSNEAGTDPAVRLARLLELSTSDLADPYGGMSTEAAIRDWARTDEAAAAAQDRTDRAREAYLAEVLAGIMAPDADPRRAARVFLMAYTGAVHLGVSDRDALAADLGHLAMRLLA